MILGDVHGSPRIYLMADENPGKLQLGGRLAKAVRPVLASNGFPYLQMSSVGSHSISGRENEGNGVGFRWEEIENKNVKIIITRLLVYVSCALIKI